MSTADRSQTTEPTPSNGGGGMESPSTQQDVTWPAVGAIWWREVVRFFRQRNRVVAAVVTPVVFWLLLGIGGNDAFRLTPTGNAPAPGNNHSVSQAVGDRPAENYHAENDASGITTGPIHASGGRDLSGVVTGTEVPEPRGEKLSGALPDTEGNQLSGGELPGVGYLEFFFPGMMVMMVLFTSIFSTISVIDDRNNGFLQGVLASPAKRWAIVLGKVLGGATIATIHGVVLLPIWCVFFSWPGVGGVAMAVLVMFVMSVGLTGLGLFFAWPMDSTAGYHAVMNLVQFPMWFLCGAVFPLGTAGVLKWVMYANPLTYGNAAFTWTLQGDRVAGIGLPIWATMLILCGSAIAALAAATHMATRRAKA